MTKSMFTKDSLSLLLYKERKTEELIPWNEKVSLYDVLVKNKISKDTIKKYFEPLTNKKRNRPISLRSAMARIKEHMEDCEKVLGKPYKQVHEFLDQYAEMFPIQIFTVYHRSFLHNRYGIEAVSAMWGIKAGQAAIIHIVRDYLELPVRKWKVVNIHYGKALMYFNQLNNFDPQIQPHIIAAWKGKSLVSIALDERKDQC